MDIKLKLKKIIFDIIKKDISHLDSFDEIMIFNSKRLNKEDYFTNIALILSDKTHQDAMIIAKRIVLELKNEMILKSEIEYPGYLNIYLNKKSFNKEINNIINLNKDYGKINIGNQKKVNINICDYYLEQRLTLYDAMKAIFADNLYRIYERCGFFVEREINIISDNIIDYQFLRFEKNLSLINELDTLRINYDKYFDKYKFNNNENIDELLNKLLINNFCHYNENRLYIDRVFLNSDINIVDEEGNYMKYLYDLAYEIKRIKDEYNYIIQVSTSINTLYNKTTQEYMKKLNIDNKKIEYVRIPDLKGLKKIDSDLLLEYFDCSINEIRFYFAYCINQKKLKCIILNKTNFNNIIKKYKYIEYVNVRISSIIEKSNLNTIEKEVEYTYSDLEYLIIRKMIEYNDMLLNSLLYKSPRIIINYLYDISKIFNKYYQQSRILDSNQEIRIKRLKLVKALKIIINNGLDLIGVLPNEKI